MVACPQLGDRLVVNSHGINLVLLYISEFGRLLVCTYTLPSTVKTDRAGRDRLGNGAWYIAATLPFEFHRLISCFKVYSVFLFFDTSVLTCNWVCTGLEIACRPPCQPFLTVCLVDHHLVQLRSKASFPGLPPSIFG